MTPAILATDPLATNPVASQLPSPTTRHLSLSDAHDLVETDDQGKWDILALRRDLTFKSGELEFLRATSELNCAFVPASPDRLSPSPYALGQICARLGIPVTYLRQCPSILQDQNVNFWLKQGGTKQAGAKQREQSPREDNGQKHPEEAQDQRQRATQPRPDDERWLLRARHGTLRAALSQHYSPLDNIALLETLTPLLPRHYRVQWIGLEEESFHLRLLDPSRAHAVLPGDDFFVGVHLANSEVGMRSLTVDAMVYRLVCSNGMVALVKGRSLLRQRHIHVAAPRFRAALEEALEQALGATETMLFQLQSASKQVVPDPGVAIERLSRHWHLSETTQEVAKAALLTESPQVQESAYGLLNAFTAAAQTLPDEKRYDLELLTGGLAQHGVPRFALSPREMTGEEGLGRKGQGGSGDQESGDGEDMVSYARELFGGRVMRRVPRQREASFTALRGES